MARFVRRQIPGRFFEEFFPHQEFHTPAIFKPFRVTAKAIRAFGKVTLDMNPLHLDKAFSRRTMHKKPILQGMYTFSLIPGIVDEAGIWRYTCLAFGGGNSFRFYRPVYAGDILSLKLLVVGKRDTVFDKAAGREKTFPDMGFVDFAAEISNQRGEKVFAAEISILIAKRGYFKKEEKSAV